ncbi:hypothetical protein [Qingshengfaniella alkalisoli]|uniref:Uncharacterized protein n=1 Tax=Qingshengfaniella alkalisoli TaxID=2599296 RepID=A0A5B8IXJ7_9RHOB|nr:hypothetical protein [Qingshengfaniella alkalisoli]QDY70444.1 hypothetical protein FPZ52_12075 [Qingshengfaniella alkalisoli]
MMLSTSELPLAYYLRRKNKDVPHALAARIIEIPADPGPHGLLHDLHGYENGAAFARDLDAAMGRHHGTLLPASKIRSRPRSYRLDRSKLMDTERSG